MKERFAACRMLDVIHRYMARLMLVIAAFCFTAENVLAQLPVADSKTYAGRVVNDDGEPIAGAEVFVAGTIYSRMRNISIPYAEVAAHTNAEGSFTIPRPLSGDVQYARTIIAHAPGFSVGGIQLSSETDPEDLVVTLRQPAPVSGVVRSMDGEPLEGVSVCISSIKIESPETEYASLSADLPGHEVVTDSEGRYSIDYLPEGATVSIVVSKPGYYGDSRPYDTTSGTDGNDLYLEPGGSIAGRVTEAETGDPVPDISITARSQSARVETRSDENGYYRLEGLRPGEFRVFVNPDDRHFGLCARPVEGVVVTLDQPVEGIDIDMLHGVTITGTVVEQGTGNPISGCPIRITMPSRDEFVMSRNGEMHLRNSNEIVILGWSYTDDNGRFKATALPGHVFVRPWPEEGYQSPYSQEVYRHVDEDGSCEEIQFSLTPIPPPITGTVYLPDGSPANGVFVAGLPGVLSFRWIANASGGFVIPWGYLRGDGMSLYADDSVRKLNGHAVADHTTGEPVEIHLKPYRYASLSGRLVDGNGETVVGTTIECHQTDSMNYTVEIANMKTDQNGAFGFDNLIMGQYYQIIVEGWRAESQQIVIKEVNEPVELVLPSSNL